MKILGVKICIGLSIMWDKLLPFLYEKRKNFLSFTPTPKFFLVLNLVAFYLLFQSNGYVQAFGACLLIYVWACHQQNIDKKTLTKEATSEDDNIKRLKNDIKAHKNNSLILDHIKRKTIEFLFEYDWLKIDAYALFENLNLPENQKLKASFNDIFSGGCGGHVGNCGICNSKKHRCLGSFLFEMLHKYGCEIHSWSIMCLSQDGKLHVKIPVNLNDEEKTYVQEKNVGLSGRAVREKQVVYCENVTDSRYGFDKIGDKYPEYNSIICLPIKHNSNLGEPQANVIGVFNIQGRKIKEFGSERDGTEGERKKYNEIKTLTENFTDLLYLGLLLTNQKMSFSSTK